MDYFIHINDYLNSEKKFLNDFKIYCESVNLTRNLQHNSLEIYSKIHTNSMIMHAHSIQKIFVDLFF